MDVTRSGLAALRGEIESDIRACCFAAIDCEFTGLNLPRSLHPLDSTAERYKKLREGITDYLVVQVGLSLWTYDDRANSYAVKTYNFYTFPDGSDQTRFWSEASSLQFLVKHGFDLNRCIRDGLPYMRPDEYQKQKESLRERHEAALAAILPSRYEACAAQLLDGSLTPAEVQREQRPPNEVRTSEAAVESFLSSCWTSIENWTTSTKPDLTLPMCNDFVRTAFYRHIERIFFNVRFEMEAVRPDHKEHPQPGMKKVRLLRSETTPLERLVDRQIKERNELEERFGLSAVLQCLSESRKPVVGHNGVRDLLHIVSQFLAPLPYKFEDFQTLCKEIFPTFFDTKYMVSVGVLKSYFRSSCLSDLYNQIRNQEKTFAMPPIVISDGYGYSEESQEHEAGYDAYITGYIFAALSQFLLPNRRRSFRKLDANDTSMIPFRNKFPFVSSLDISCFDLELGEEKLLRKNVFIVAWPSSEDLSTARSLVNQLGGFKRIAYGERLLAFTPNDLGSCLTAIANPSRTATLDNCRLFKFGHEGGGPPQHKQQANSPPPLSGGGVSSKAKTHNRGQVKPTRSSPPPKQQEHQQQQHPNQHQQHEKETLNKHAANERPASPAEGGSPPGCGGQPGATKRPRLGTALSTGTDWSRDNRTDEMFPETDW